MKPGEFIVDGWSSITSGIFIQDRPDIQAPRRRVEFQDAYGRSGSLPFDEGAYDNTESTYSLLIASNNRHVARELLYSKLDGGSYHKIQNYYDPDKYYYAMLNGGITFTNKEWMGEYQIAEVPLTIKPYKHIVSSPILNLTNNQVVQNTRVLESLPRIKLTGTGDCTITIGGRPFVIKNIQGHIWIDSEIEMAYQESAGVITNQNNKIYTKEYPYLAKGNNKITWTGTFTVQFEPRWRALV